MDVCDLPEGIPARHCLPLLRRRRQLQLHRSSHSQPLFSGSRQEEDRRPPFSGPGPPDLQHKFVHELARPSGLVSGLLLVESTTG